MYNYRDNNDFKCTMIIIHVAMVFGNNNHKLHQSMLANNSNASRLSSHDLNGELQQTDLIITNVHVCTHDKNKICLSQCLIVQQSSLHKKCDI